MNGWNKLPDKLPPECTQVLVCYRGGHMFVSEGRIFDSQSLQQMKDTAPEGFKPAPGYFKHDHEKVYFNEDDIYWQKLPEPPKENTVEESKTIVPEIVGSETPVPGKTISRIDEGRLNAAESQNGEMSLQEIGEFFDDKNPVEQQFDYIYQIASRIKNSATMAAGGNLTPVGVMLCNTYTHTIKEFYDFADTIKDKTDKNRLRQFILKQEGMAATFIGAAMSNVAGKRRR